MSQVKLFSRSWLLSCAVVFLACSSSQPQQKDHAITDVQKKLDVLEGKVDELQKQQERLLAQQETGQKEMMKKIEENKNSYRPLRELAEYDKERQLVETPIEKIKRAMQEVRILATAVQAYATDANKYPENPANTDISTMYGKLGEAKLCRISDIAKDLFPAYHRGILAWDPWGKPYMYWASPDRQHFLIASMGEDGRWNPYEALQLCLDNVTKSGYAMPPPFNLPCYETDIIWCDDGYLQFPQGPLHHCHDAH